MEKVLNQWPKVSVIVEGYNQSRDLGTAEDTIAALRWQEFDLSTVEVILAGSPEQVKGWESRFAGESHFHSLRPYSLAGAHYYSLKNAGAMVATGEILAFTDSDVIPSPRWLASLVEAIDNGAVATAGITQFRPSSGLKPDSIVMMMVASVTWGWVVGRSPEAARGFMDHNLGIRADAFREIQYETQYGRILASPLLFRALQKVGKSVRLVSQQRAGHHFTFRYWMKSLHFRYGYEVYQLRRMDEGYPVSWLRWFGPVEPIVSMGWHMMLDVPRWFRYAQASGVPVWKAVGVLPLLLLISTFARGCEMVGMYSTMLWPVTMRRWAENV